jgi:peptidoglycan-associated lipoprotein
MKLVSKSLLSLALCAAVLLTGCTKKPIRPDPSATVIGPQTGGNINPQLEREIRGQRQLV